MPGYGTRPFATLDERRQHVAARYLKGELQSQIAHALGLSQQQISFDLKAIREQWRHSAIRDFDEAKAKELAKIDLLEIEAWQAWERSKQPREITVTEALEGGERAPTRKASVRREGQAGDPRFLTEIGKCIERRCDLLGLSLVTEAAKELSTGLAGLLAQARAARSGEMSLPLPNDLAQA